MLKTISPVRAVTWNKDGTTFAYAEEKNIFVRDSSGYTLIQSIETSNDPINFLEFTQNTVGDGLNQLASLSQDKYLRFWILPEKDPLHVSKVEGEGQPTAFAYNNNGNYIATADTDGTIKIYMQNYLTNTFISRTLGTLNVPVYSLQFSYDNRYLVSGSADDSACIWNTASGKLVQAFPYYSESKVPVLITNDSNNIIMTTDANTAGIFDMSFNKLRQITTDVAIKSMQVSSDGAKLIILTADNVFHFYSIEGASLTNYIPAFNESPITAYAFNNVTSKVVICHEDGSLYVLDLRNLLLDPDEEPEAFAAVTEKEKESGEVDDSEKETSEETKPYDPYAKDRKAKEENEPEKEELPEPEEDANTFYKDGHGIIANFGVGMMPNPYSMNIHLTLGYRNYELLKPFYFGGFIEPFMGFPSSSYPYSYEYDGTTLSNPVMVGARLYAPFGICIYPLRNDFEIFAEVYPGIAFTKLWNGRFDQLSAATKFYPSFLMGIKFGVAWDFMNLTIGGNYDFMFGFSASIEAGVIINLGGSRTIWGKKRK